MAVHPRILGPCPVEDELLPEYGTIVNLPCYPAGDVHAPQLPTIEDCFLGAGRFAISYIDNNNTVQVIRVTPAGETPDYPEKISRLNSKAPNRFVQRLAIAPGIHPRSVIVFSISLMYGTKTLLACSEVVLQELIVNAATTSALFLDAFRECCTRLEQRNRWAQLLEIAQKVVREDFDDLGHVDNVRHRDYVELRFLLAAEEWRQSYFAAVIAQIAAIKARIILITAPLVSRVETVKTEARRLNAKGVPELPAPILPAQ